MTEPGASHHAHRPVLTVLDDFGPVGKGASNGRVVRASNGTEYILKGRGLSPGHPLVAANEFIAVELARLLGLPTLDHDVVELEGVACFASQFMTAGSFAPQIDAGLFAKCVNQEVIYGLVVFDAWICNPDRHHENLVVRANRHGGGESLLLNDHSHCLVMPGETSGILAGRVGSPIAPNVTPLSFIREAVTSVTALAEALARVEAVPDGDLRSIVAAVRPEWWVDGQDGRAYLAMLSSRRSVLRRSFEAERAIFPNLGTEAIQ